MLRTAGGARACDAPARVEPRSDAEFVREVAAAVASDEKVLALCRCSAALRLWPLLRIQSSTGSGATQRGAGAANGH